MRSLAGTPLANGHAPAADASALADGQRRSAAEWVDTLVAEMSSAQSVEEARQRAARLLQAFEQAVLAAEAQARSPLRRGLGWGAVGSCTVRGREFVTVVGGNVRSVEVARPSMACCRLSGAGSRDASVHTLVLCLCLRSTFCVTTAPLLVLAQHILRDHCYGRAIRGPGWKCWSNQEYCRARGTANILGQRPSMYSLDAYVLAT